MFQQVVGDEPHRAIPFQRCSNAFAAQPSLQLIKAKRCGGVLLPADQLAVQNAAGWQGLGHLHKLREALVDQLFSTAPEVDAGAAMNQLTADSIPFPLQLPIARRCLQQSFGFQGTGEIEGVGGAAGTVFIRRRAGGELPEALGGGLKAAHQPLHHKAFLEIKCFGDGPADQPCRHADTESPREQLVDDEVLVERGSMPEPDHGIGLIVVASGADGRQQGVHPPAQGHVSITAGQIRIACFDALLHGGPEQADGFS